MLWLGTLWKDWPTKAMLTVCKIWSTNQICWASNETGNMFMTQDCQEWRREDVIQLRPLHLMCSMLLNQLARPRGTVNTPLFYICLEQQGQEWERLDGSTTGPGVAETATTLMGSGVSRSHERGSLSSVFHSGVSSAARKLPVHSSPQWVCLHLSPS